MKISNLLLQQSLSTTPPGLLDRVHQEIRLKHYSFRTEEAYSDWIKRFIQHHGKCHPGGMGAVGAVVEKMPG